MDITYFMEWFIEQIARIFTWAFNLLDSITFSGTSLLGILITITILGAILPVLLTLATSGVKIKTGKEKYHKNTRSEEE